MTTVRTPTGRLLLPASAIYTDQWYEARRTRVGGSDVAALLGLSPWLTWFDLWWTKRGKWEQSDNEAMLWGKLLESAVRVWFKTRHQEWKVFVPGTYVHVDRDYQLASPDGLLCPDSKGYAIAGFEAKCERWADGWGEPGTDEIPVHYRCQVLWYMDALGIDEWHVVLLVGGQEYREYLVQMDADGLADLELMHDAAQRFLHDLAHDVAPGIDEHTTTHQILRQAHPLIDATKLVTVDDTLAEEYWAAEDVYRAAEGNRRYYQSVLLDAIGHGKGALTADGRKVAYRHPSNHDAPPHLRDWRPRKTRPPGITVKQALEETG